MLQGRLYSDAQFNAINAKLAQLENNQLKPPQFLPFGGYVSATCNNYNPNCGCG